MAEMTFRDRLKIAALSAERSQRSAIAQTLATWLPAWSVAPHPVDRLLIVPQDLRTADPSFWREIEHGQFGLAGSIAFLHGHSPFDIAPPTAAWERELHSFGWLRNIAAATDDDEARRAARLLASEWAIRFGGSKGVAAEPMVAARRLISWVSHAMLLLEGADVATYEAITMSLGRQIALLASSRRDAPDGYPRLLTLIALMFAELSVAGQKRKLKDVEPTLVAELRRQILPDGGHMSRNPDVLVELLLDLLPLNQCFAARNRESPPQLVEVLARLQAMLRFLRLGDGMLARFNGVGAAAAAGLGTIVAYGDSAAPLPSEARASGYARLARGTSIVVVDVGSPPALAVGGDAQAGCLSFEMSAGRHLLFVNGGMPGGAAADWNPAARATANHNTLCLAEQSSAKLVAQQRLRGAGM
ncbi:MAG: heparinase II/III family protein, partial [Hyphomicrobium sp.]